MKLPLVSLAVLGSWPITSGLAPAQEPAPPRALATQLTPDQMAADIEQLARAVREEWSYFSDRTSNFGLDLEALVKSARASSSEPLAKADFGRVLRRFVAALGDGHGGVRFDGDSLPTHYALVRAVDTSAGLVLAEVGDSMTVDPNARAPEVGDLLIAVDDTPVESLIAELQSVTCGSTLAQRRALAIEDLRVADGPEIQIETEDSSGVRHTVALKTRAWPLMPERNNWDLGWPAADVALLRIESFAVKDWAAWTKAAPEDRAPFLEDTFERIAGIFTELHERKAAALILDLRGNAGGTDALGSRLARHLLHEPFKYYLLSAKNHGSWSEPWGETHESLATDTPFRGPVIALTDAKCFSTTDNLLRCLRDLHPRFTVIGQPSGGGTGAPREIVRLDHSGAGITLCTMRVWGPKGALIEGRGTRPDVLVKTSRQDLRDRKDATLETALARLRDRR